MAVRYIYNTNGEYVAFIESDNLFSPDGSWLGFLINGNFVYQRNGRFIGYVTSDDRIARNTRDRGHSAVFPPMQPLSPLRPVQPFKRLRMSGLQSPYEDVFSSPSKGLAEFGIAPNLRH